MIQQFELGRVVRVVATPAVAEKISMTEMLRAVARHARGDWGTVDEDDKRANDAALLNGSRVFSEYLHAGTAFWVITEADRSATTGLLPEDY